MLNELKYKEISIKMSYLDQKEWIQSFLCVRIFENGWSGERINDVEVGLTCTYTSEILYVNLHFTYMLLHLLRYI